jgi:hypothetical protein
MNSNQSKRRLLIWLIGFVIFNLPLLFIVILLIYFVPSSLVRRAVGDSCSRLKHGHRLRDTSCLEGVFDTLSYMEVAQQLASFRGL